MGNPLLFLLNSILFGIALAMDAFSVSLANGLRCPHMGARGAVRIAGTFALFQVVMPLTGWFLVHTVSTAFSAVQPLIPWIALTLLLYIGGGMLLEGIRESRRSPSLTGTAPSGLPSEKQTSAPVPSGELSAWNLLLLGIATSIDALSVGFTIADYTLPEALSEALIIGIVTFFICIAGIRIGKTAGTRLSGKSAFLGGSILIFIGIEILISSLCA